MLWHLGRTGMKGFKTLALAAMALVAVAGAARAQLPEPKSETWVIKDFRFHDGSVLPQMKVHYLTLGDPKNPAVVMLHGTGGNGAGMLNPAFGGVLFAKGGALDASRYFIVLPDAIGHGESSKPSDGLRMTFPAYDYADMVEVQHQLLEHLGVKHLALVSGNSMGGMLSWQWAEQYPDFMDAIAPMASTPAAMAARNWIFRRLVIDAIETDPAWNGGNYTAEPKGLTLGMTYFGLLSAGGTRAQYAQLPTWKATDDLVAQRMAGRAGGDANDTIYQLLAARDYDPAPRLGAIKARVLAINSADDERNPAELGLTAQAVKRLKGSRYFEIPAYTETRGHGTTGSAHWFDAELKRFMDGK
jgi:homoserine O-acetyltransferase/O-succinyltransferase